MTDRIICLVGPSGSGKTTIAKYLEQGYGVNVIKPYTTRIPRVQNEYGYNFIDETEAPEILDRQQGFTFGLTNFHDGLYFANQAMYLGKGDSIYVVDPLGAEGLPLELNFSVEITVVLINLDKSEREKRLIEEYRQNPATRSNVSFHKEIVHRMQRDGNKFDFIKTDFSIYNHSSDYTAELIFKKILRSI